MPAIFSSHALHTSVLMIECVSFDPSIIDAVAVISVPTFTHDVSETVGSRRDSRPC